MTRRPPRSTLFPTRRSSDLAVISRSGRTSETVRAAELLEREHDIRTLAVTGTRNQPLEQIARSEEHTSELQSLTNLVCRLLLEKKKKKMKKMNKNKK